MIRVAVAALVCAAALASTALAAAGGAEPRDAGAIVGGAPATGYVLEGASGLMDLDAFTWDTARRGRLARAGYQAAFQRFWSAGKRSASGFAAVFRTTAGAHAGIASVYDARDGSVIAKVPVSGIGDEVAGYRVRGQQGVSHVVVFRRGNVVAVAAVGGAGAREAAEASAYAKAIDRRALERL